MRLLLYELRPSEYLQDGLVAALQRRLDAVENRTGMEVSFTVKGILPGLDEAQEVALYRIAEEALNNTLKHSNAHQVSVGIHANGEQVELVVADNGSGFDPTRQIGAGGIGLSSMRERARGRGRQRRDPFEPGRGHANHRQDRKHAMTETIRILIVDDHTVVRDGLNALLSLEQGMHVVGMASDGEEAVRLAPSSSRT